MPNPIPFIQAGIGLAQTIGGLIGQKKANKQLEKLDANSPKYQQNQGILDYYNQALQRYGVSPTDSAMYKRNEQLNQRGLATGINALQDRRSGTAGVSSLLRGYNDAALDSSVAAENEKSRRFGELGTATGMKAGEDRLAFDINQVQPFERKYNRLSQKSGASSSIVNAGIGNVFGGLQSYNDMKMLEKMYGSGGGASGNSTSTQTPTSGNVWFNRNQKTTRPLWQIGWRKP